MNEIDLEYLQLMESISRASLKPASEFESSTIDTLGDEACLYGSRVCLKENCVQRETFVGAWYMGFIDAVELYRRNTSTSKALIESVVSEWRKMATKENSGREEL